MIYKEMARGVNYLFRLFKLLHSFNSVWIPLIYFIYKNMRSYYVRFYYHINILNIKITSFIRGAIYDTFHSLFNFLWSLISSRRQKWQT